MTRACMRWRLLPAVALLAGFVPAFLIPALASARGRAPGASAEPYAGRESLEGLDSLAAATLLRAMDDLGIAPGGFGFDKLYAEDDTFRLPLVERLLRDPLGVPAWQAATSARIRESVIDGWPALPAVLGDLMGDGPQGEGPAHAAGEGAAGGRAQPPDAGTAAGRPQPAGGGESADLDATVAGFVRSCQAAQRALDRAFARFESDELQLLLTLAPAIWGEEKDPLDRAKKGRLHFECGARADTAIEFSPDPLLNLAAKLDRRALIEAASIFCAAVDSLAAGIPPAAAGLVPYEMPGVEGPVLAERETPWGRLLIGGAGPNRYGPEIAGETPFLLDLGGGDLYAGRFASAVGVLRSPFSALIDFAGDDVYAADACDYVLGGALLGVAVLLDREGDDVYRGADGCLGAGLFGAGLLIDGCGVDCFSGVNFCQGAGACGIGVLASGAAPDPPPGMELDPDRAYAAGWTAVPGTGAIPVRHDENDVYRCARQAQGFGATLGVGLLADRAGGDTYVSGGRYRHAPLLPNDFQSLAQGCASGFRPRAAGGIGLLLDGEGNDFYDAEVYAQGVAYWYALGLLWDGGGNDLYHATQYAQGAGVHLAVGALWDRGGDDHYVSRLGVTQGTAHDLSVGWLCDESGNDYYLVSDGQGMSIANSASFFIDGFGDDIYATRGVGQGALTWARGFAGSALFLDLEGRDCYPRDAPGADGSVWSADLHALGIDLDRDLELPGEVLPEIVLTAEDSVRAVAELFETASLWEVGSAREKVRRARLALNARGNEAIDYVVPAKLGTRESLELRAITELAQAHPDSFAARLLTHLAGPDRQTQRNAVGLLGDLAWKPARVPLEELLEQRAAEPVWPRIIDALGRIGDPAASAAVRPFLKDSEERRRICSLAALAALRDTVSLGEMIPLLADPWLTVRAAASQGVASFSAAAADPLSSWLAGEGAGRGGAERVAGRIAGLHTLGRIALALADSTGPAEVAARRLARRTLMAELDLPASAACPAARAAAVRALLGLGDAGTAAFVRLRMEDESDPLVRRTFDLARRKAEGSLEE